MGKARVNLLASRSRHTRNRPGDMSSGLNVSVSTALAAMQSLDGARPQTREFSVSADVSVASTPLQARPDVLQAASPRPLESPG